MKGWPIEAVVVFIAYLFDAFDYRKLYIEGPEFNLGWLKTPVADSVLVEEASFRNRDYINGRHYDWKVYALYRERFDLIAERFLRRHELIQEVANLGADPRGVS